ncbi:MAG: ATP-grasp domain-containing protein [Gemmataceae bacterium]
MAKKHLHVALVFNAYSDAQPEAPEDRGSMTDLKQSIRNTARKLRRLGHRVTIIPLADDLFRFQRKLRRINPDVVFNLYDDVVHGALYDMRLAALVRMMGYPMTGCPALALGLTRYKFMAASLLMGAGVPIPSNTHVLETASAVDRYDWHFPIIVQPTQEHAGVGLERNSVVSSKKALKEKVREILTVYKQPALAQRFLPGREFNVSVIGGNRLRVLPLAEVNYEKLPPEIPPIMSYAAKWVETSVEYQNTSVICPADVEPELAERIQQVTLAAFRAVGGRGYGRVDIRLDEQNQPCVLEVNCNPCLDEGMALARSAERAGISYPRLLHLILMFALEPQPFDPQVPMMPPETRRVVLA